MKMFRDTQGQWVCHAMPSFVQDEGLRRLLAQLLWSQRRQMLTDRRLGQTDDDLHRALMDGMRMAIEIADLAARSGELKLGDVK